jgi:hypothetical protein
MKTLTLSPAETENLRNLVRNVFTLMDSDEDGILLDLYDPAATAAEILGIASEVTDHEGSV